MALFGVVAFLGALASASPLADAEENDSAITFSCSVVGVVGGIELSWTSPDGVAGFNYKLDAPGVGSSYGSAQESPMILPVTGEERVIVGMAPVFDDAAAQSRTPCGAAAPSVPVFEVEFRCTLTQDDDGVVAAWNDVDGVASYGLQVVLEGESNPRYRRTTSTRTHVAVADGENVRIGVAPVFADGSTRPRVDCSDPSA